MSKKNEDGFEIGQSRADGIWELTPRAGDTLNGLKIRISDQPPAAPAGAGRKSLFDTTVVKLLNKIAPAEKKGP